MKLRITNVYRWALVIGLVIRVGLAPITAHPWDTYVFYDTAQTILQGRDFYGATAYSYPPGWAGFLAVVGAFYRPLAAAWGAHPITSARVDQLIGVPVELGSPQLVDWLFLMLMKTPLIVGDLLVALLLGRVVGTRFNQPSKSKLAFSAFFLNPLVIWISSVWGMFDILPTYFALVGILLFLDKRNFAAGLAFGVGVGLKYFPVILVLALLCGLRKGQDRRSVRDLLLGLGSVVAALSIPFLLLDAPAFLTGVFSPASGVTTGQLSVWSVANLLGVVDLPVLAAALNIGVIALAIALITWAVGALRSSLEPTFWIDLAIIAILLFFVLFRLVNDQYTIWLLPFLTLNVVLARERAWTLIGISGLVLVASWVNVGHYSFFLPMVTASPTLAADVPRMWLIPAARIVLAVVFWLFCIVLLRGRLKSVAGKGEISGFLGARFRALLAFGKRRLHTLIGPR